MRCEICDKGPLQGRTVYRINAKGMKGRWACEEHYKQFDALPIDPTVLKITKALENKEQ